MISSVFFDLDGTLADTAPDLAAALNQILHEQEQSTLPLELIRPFVSLGANAMVKRGFSIEEDDSEFDNLKQRFLNAYQQRLHKDTNVFPGIDAVLNYLERKNITWGVVTNKPKWLTKPVMERLKLGLRAACVISGDTTPYQKPHPGSILYACAVTQCNSETSLYIGDALRDIEAGRAAKMKTLTANYGYISNDENPNEWNADGMVSSPKEIIEWLKNNNTSL